MEETWYFVVEQVFVQLCSFTAVVSIVLSTVFKHELYIANKLLLGNVLAIIELLFNGGQVHGSLRNLEGQ